MNVKSTFTLTALALAAATLVAGCNNQDDTPGDDVAAVTTPATDDGAMTDPMPTDTMPADMPGDATGTGEPGETLALVMAVDQHEVAAAEQARDKDLPEDVAEYANMLLVSFLTATFFLGGWLSPVPAAWIPDLPVLSVLLGDGWWWLFAKAFFFASCFIWFRASFPRYRYDQIMRLGWKVFIPLAIAWIAVTALMAYFGVFEAGA